MSAGRRLLLLLSLITGLGCFGLGTWQLRRLFDRRARNAAALAQRDLPPVDLNRSSLAGRVSYRRVAATGRYDFDRQVALRGRVFRGAPGIQVVTPLRLRDRDTAILVNRGFVPTPDAGLVADTLRYPEPAETTVAGIAIAVPDEGDGAPLMTGRGETWRRLDLTALRDRLPYPIAGYYVVAAPAAGSSEHTLKGRSLPIRVEPPPLDDGPHLSYAIQWFLLGGAALGFGIFFVKRGTGAVTLPDRWE